ncbi:hypothetical protein EXVG_00100 [Emiliania huxleyi virus 202]|nr:hypothetical protein EXVG_00100 [Emiliania huxleyi virus 202]AHA54447.1 putative membrane protein [Emiliania huxleyi virus 18]AHA55488.1 putative membrane protein [Emiliania huxleyi virus 156]
MTTIDLKYLLLIGLPLLIILCVIMFMIGRQSGKKYVYRMMNGGQGPHYNTHGTYYRPESATDAAARIVAQENRANKERQTHRPHVPSALDIPGMNATTDAGRIYNQGGWLSWLGSYEGARG